MPDQRDLPVHVVHIIPRLTHGGAERFVVSLAQYMDDPSIRQSVITLWDDAPLRTLLPSSVSYQSLCMDTVPYHRRIRTLSQMLTSLGSDVVHTHLFSADLWGRLAARRVGIPVVTTEHNINTSEPWLWHMIKRVMRGMSQVYTAPSRAVVRFLERAYHVPTSAIRLIPHGIDCSRFASLPAPTFHPPIRLGIVGRLSTQKGHSIALSALAQLSDLPVVLTITGSGELRDQLMQEAEVLGISDRIVWHEAVTDVVPVYGALDIVLVPSLWEGFGLVALEAMASERVVIASDVDGLGDIVTDKQTGRLVPAGNSTALAEVIREVVGDRESALALARAGRVYAQEHGDIRTMMTAYTTLYTDIVSVAL